MHLFSMRRLSIGVALLLLIGTMAAFGQAGTGTLTGLITDPTGAVINKADITLVNDQTGIVRKTAPSSAGVYTFPALPVVGTYTLTVAVEGFRDYKASEIVISTGATANIDVKLQLGAAKETVTVEAGMQAVQTTESQVSGLVDSRVWEQMPLENRNQNAFINLVPGAVPDTTSTRGASVNGARGGTGNYMVEGMDNNDQGQGGRGQISPAEGGAVTLISPDAIQEYRVITNSFAAEYGKAGGFVTDTVLKSGTNNFHGSLYEYNRIQALAANSYFSNHEGIKDRLVRNQFGGAIGGPVIKDKSFFFGSLEFHRMRQTTPLHAIGTTQDYLNWVDSGGLQQWAESSPNGICNNQKLLDTNFGDADATPGSSGMTAAPCPGAFANSGKLGATFNKMRAVGPFPLAPSTPCAGGNSNCDPSGWYTGSYSPFPVAAFGDVYVGDPYYVNEYKISGKFDHKFTDKDQLSVMYLMQNAKSGDPYGGGGNTIGPEAIEVGRNQNLGITWNHTLSNSVLNTFKASYLRHLQNYPLPSAALETMPMVLTYNDALSVGLGLYSGLPQYFTDNQFQFQDHLSFIRGKHNFKTGWEYRRIRNGSSFHNDAAGTFYPWGVEDLVTDLNFTDEAAAALGVKSPGSGLASAAVDTTNGQLPNFYRGFRDNEFAAYFQDDWRVSNRLTFNLGVRWEYFGPPHNFQKNIDSNFYFGNPTAGLMNNAVCSSTNKILTNCHTSNAFFPITPFSAQVQNGNFQVRNAEIWNKDTNNFGPRVGFAFDVLGNQKLVLRAGAGVMYDRIYNNVFENIRFNPPYFSDNQIGNLYNGYSMGALSTPGLYGYPFNSRALFTDPKYAPKPNPRHMDQNLVSPYYEQAHVGLQWEFANGYVFEPEYVGNFGHKLIGYYDINTFNGRVACNPSNGPFDPGTPCGDAGYTDGFSTGRISQIIGADNYRTNCCSSNYHGLQLTLRKNYSNGLGFQANYTWSKSMDTLSDLFNYKGSYGATDVQNLGYDYGPSDFNMPQRFVGNVTYELPFMKNNRWIGGWTVNSIVSIQSGASFGVYSSSTAYDANKDGRGGDRYVPKGVAPMGSVMGNIDPVSGALVYFNKADWGRYTCPSSLNGGMWCDPPIGRNSMTGPGYWNTDFSISKKFKVTERAGFTFQANFFNLFNHTNFNNPSGNAASPDFGKSTTTYPNRITQLALRFDF
ncbi:MAG TPA: TonB-dependent receptor [Terriglobales bacterium]|nr:TonB-dependent receptor [Terriglobales bacterium]